MEEKLIVQPEEPEERLTLGEAMKWLGQQIKRAWVYIFTFRWGEDLLAWLILSAGTLSGCVFFVAGLWMMVNASVHPFILLLMSENFAKVLSYLATTAFTGLPEFLLPLAAYTVYSHYRTWRYTKDRTAMTWFFLFVVPGGCFLVITLITLSFSMANAQFTLPMWLIVPRGVMAFFYGFFSLIYPKIGKPGEAERLRKRDEQIKNLQKEMQGRVAELTAQCEDIARQWQDETHALRIEITALSQQINTLNGEKSELYRSLHESSEAALEAWGDTVINWLNGLDKSVHIDVIASVTGISKKVLKTAYNRKDLRSRGTNEDLIWVPSLREYLIKNPPKRDGIPTHLHVVGE